MSSNSISVVIPVYNSEESLLQLCERLNSVLKKNLKEYEIILVNDDSKDSSGDIINQLDKKYEWVKGVYLLKNYGQHNALLCGIRKAKYGLIATLDDDLQNPPEEIPKLIDKLNEGYDVVYGTPEKEQHGLFRNLASITVKVALKTTMGAETASHVSAFRVFRTRLREAFMHYRGPFVSIDVLLTWGTNKFYAIKVQHDSRELGNSNYSFRKLFVHAFNMITGFSVLPLKIASILGFVFAFFGLLVLIYVVGRFLIQGSPIQGFTFLVSIISIFSGAQLLAIGIIGEYLTRMHFRSMDKPQYVEMKNDIIH